MCVVVEERESSGGGGGRVHVFADHLEHVRDGECLVFTFLFLQMEKLRRSMRYAVAVQPHGGVFRFETRR